MHPKRGTSEFGGEMLEKEYQLGFYSGSLIYREVVGSLKYSRLFGEVALPVYVKTLEIIPSKLTTKWDT